MNTKKVYSCSQSELYTIATTGWNNCASILDKFTAFKAKYTPAYIEARKAELEAMHRLPDQHQRSEVHHTLRLYLKELSSESINYWKMLKMYISDAYPSNVVISKLEAAGQSYFLKAKEKLGDCEMLLKSGSEFILQNSAQLLEKDNMPVDFPNRYDEMLSKFRKMHQDFINGEVNAVKGTNVKIEAANLIFENLTAMFKDAIVILKDDPSSLKMFSYSNLLQLVSKTLPARLFGTVKDVAGNPVSAAVISVVDSELEYVTDEDGTFVFSPIAGGTYKLSVEASGYKSQTLPSVKVEPGTRKVVDVTVEAEDVILKEAI